MATQKIEMGRGKDTEYESKKRAAMAQADSMNDYMWGVQQMYIAGSGAATKASRSHQYGNTNLVTGDLIDGQEGIFKPKFDTAGGQVVGDPMNTTGYLDGQTSMTINPQADPEMAGGEAMQRVQMIAAGMQYPGLNNREQSMNIGFQ